MMLVRLKALISFPLIDLTRALSAEVIDATMNKTAHFAVIMVILSGRNGVIGAGNVVIGTCKGFGFTNKSFDRKHRNKVFS